MIILGIVKTVT